MPPEVLRARKELAERALDDRSLHLMGVIEEARIVTSSTWRMKLGGSSECAVCDVELDEDRTNLCEEHSDFRFLWRRHAGTADEHRRFLLEQLFSMAQLPIPDGVLETLEDDK